MRPIRLELEGFTAFRSRTEVDFEGAELFVFSGPTGSGKSSLIDAITFALYGSISRYANTGLVYPVVSQGLQEARVRFDFELNSKRYSVVRVVRRQQRGDTWSAITKEARLECGEKSLAGTVKDLDSQIQHLFGLSFEQFTTCVVLPQGEFAKFLLETPAKRQDILKELLGIRIYEKMGQVARQLESEAKQEVKLLQERLKESVEVTPEARAEAQAYIRRLAELKKGVDKAARELDNLYKTRDDLLERATEEKERLASLEKLKKPSNTDSLIAGQRQAETEVENVKKERSEAERVEKKEELSFKELPDKSQIQKLLDAHEELEEKEGELAEAIEDVEQSKEKANKAQHSLQLAKDRLENVSQVFDEARRNLAALEIARGLKVGEVCPVCLSVVDKLPKHLKGTHLSDLKKERDDAAERKEEANEHYRKTSSAHSADTAKLKQIQGAIERLKEKLKKGPPLADLQKQLKNIQAIQERLDDAREKAEAARKSERQALDKVDQVNGRVRKAWEEYSRLRDTVARYDPPAPNRNDLGASWKLLTDWRDKQRQSSIKQAESLAAELTKTTKEVREKESSVVAVCGAEGIDVEDATGAKDEIVHVLARAEEKLNSIDATIKERKGIERKLEGKKRAVGIAGTLERHLRSNAFERWILQEAFERLREGGSQRLEELSSGDYSFQLDDQLNFDIVDHRNADEVRSVRTLSGGETFLASLALALTLAEQLAEMAAEGAARLESIFLDEGFGALDSEALDLVASTIEELGSRGRVVGLVTHVKELAERIPVQFRVTKTQNSSSVERISV